MELTYHGMLVKELSEKTGICKRTLDNYLRENGSMPPADYAVLIAKALDTNVEFLVTGRSGSGENFSFQKATALFSKLSEADQNFFLKLMEAVSRK